MPRITEDSVRETTATTGTGAFALAGAATGFRSFASVMATNDTCFYCAQGGAEWEIGIGTLTGATTLARTTVLSSSNAGGLVNFSAGTKDVFITVPAREFASDVLLVTPSADLDDYNPTGLAGAARLRLNPSASITMSGLAAGWDGKTITISNVSANLVILEHESTGSSAANRFDLPNAFPFFLMPGDRVTFAYSTISNRWQFISSTANSSQMGLTEFTDCVASNASAATGPGSCGPFSVIVAGTGASGQPGNYLLNTTERPLGIYQIDTGTSATGRATIGSSTDSIIPALGPMLSVARIAAEALPSGTETFQLFSGFIDSAGGTPTDGVCWNLRWNGTAVEWSKDRFNNATATRDVSGSPTADTNYIWLVVFMNAAGTRADFYYSTDSVNFISAGSATTGLPPNTRPTGWAAASIIKSLGTTQRNASVDLCGYRVDYARA